MEVIITRGSTPTDTTSPGGFFATSSTGKGDGGDRREGRQDAIDDTDPPSELRSLRPPHKHLSLMDNGLVDVIPSSAMLNEN